MHMCAQLVFSFTLDQAGHVSSVHLYLHFPTAILLHDLNRSFLSVHADIGSEASWVILDRVDQNCSNFSIISSKLLDSGTLVVSHSDTESFPKESSQSDHHWFKGWDNCGTLQEGISSHSDQGHGNGQFLFLGLSKLDTGPVGQMCRQEGGWCLALLEFRMTKYGITETTIVLDSFNDVFIESLGHDINGFLTSGSVGDNLGEHGVVEWCYDMTLSNPRIHSEVTFALTSCMRFHVRKEWPAAWQVAAQRIFGVDTAFNGVSLARHEESINLEFWWESAP
mmetsp:Transcript_38607/g.93339  ORF Transcript_38607/g.93339 Transcript_38607/m.93339 type:complete len:280 (+) Transcript_38607:395-1234(+)